MGQNASPTGQKGRIIAKFICPLGRINEIRLFPNQKPSRHEVMGQTETGGFDEVHSFKEMIFPTRQAMHASG
ncbi:hypothetical protein HOB30_05960, partial [Candidatus Falkowbacteria bacterium]|nr:hypothetical protein [Candidatus Falkowbacteria bacterium]